MTSRRILRLALLGALLLPACDALRGGCARRPKQEIPIAKTPEPIAKSSADASPDVSAPKRVPGPEWHGTYATAETPDGAKTSLLKLRTFGAASDTPKLLYTSATDPIVQIVFAPDGASIAFVTTQLLDGGQMQTLQAMRLDETAPRTLAKCAYACTVLGIAEGGDVWFLDTPTSSLVSSVHRVPMKGGPKSVWPHWFADCAISGVVSNDGRSLLLGVDDSLGWPDCINGGYQGFYVIPISDPAKRDLMPTRTACFTTLGAKEINLVISHLAFEGADRIAFVANDGWDSDASIDPLMPWSCKRDGTDPKRTKTLPPYLDRRAIEGNDWVVAAIGPDGVDDDPLRLLGPFDAVTAFARKGGVP